MDALVNAAAYGAGGVPLARMPTEMLDRHLEVDLRAMFLTIRAALPMLTEAGAEHGKALVVNVSSLAAKGGTPGMTFYAAAKAGVNALTESAQAEARDAGIQFTIFSPGFTATPMATWTKPGRASAPEEMVQPADLGEALRFLLRTSPTCLVREIEFTPPGQRSIIERLGAWRSQSAPSSRSRSDSSFQAPTDARTFARPGQVADHDALAGQAVARRPRRRRRSPGHERGLAARHDVAAGARPGAGEQLRPAPRRARARPSSPTSASTSCARDRGGERLA